MKKQLLSFTLAAIGAAVQAQNVTIPDANFKNVLITDNSIDTNLDDEIQVSEAQAYTGGIICDNKNITDLTGIEAFTNITELFFNNNQVTSVDISHNTALTNLTCSYNQLSSLDVSQNTALQYIFCDNNQLTALDVSANSALKFLICNDNLLTTLDVSQNAALKTLECLRNQLTGLTVGIHTQLQLINCAENQLTNLDVSQNTGLAGLVCYKNQLSTLNISQTPLLQNLSCSDNLLTSIDVSQNTALKNFVCYSNQLPSLDLSQNTNLILLAADTNQLTTASLILPPAGTTTLTQLELNANQLTTLDFSMYPNLTALYVADNLLTALNLKNGNNSNFVIVHAVNNPNLTCVEVDDAAHSTTNWNGYYFQFDNGVTFNENCSLTTSIAEKTLTTLNIYPNPANDVLNVSVPSAVIEDVEVMVINVLGNVVIKNTYNPASGRQAVVNVSELPKGVYFLKAGSVTKKFVKE